MPRTRSKTKKLKVSHRRGQQKLQNAGSSGGQDGGGGGCSSSKKTSPKSKSATGSFSDTSRSPASGSSIPEESLNNMSLEILCLVLRYLPVRDVLMLESLSRRLQQAALMHLHLLTELDLCEGQIYGWVPPSLTDPVLFRLLSRCTELVYLFGLHPRHINKRRQRTNDSLSIPGVLAALRTCPNLMGVETCDIFLLEAVTSSLPHLSILGAFKNRTVSFPIIQTNKINLTRNSKLTSLHLTSVVISHIPRMDQLKHLFLKWVKMTDPHPFRDFGVPALRTFVMSSCAGPTNALKYVPLITGLAQARSLSRLELIRVPFLGGLIQHVVEDSWKMHGFRNIQKVVLGSCKHTLEVDLGYLCITCCARLEEVAVQPSLTKDSFFSSLARAEVVFPLFDTLRLGYVDDFISNSKWTNQDLSNMGLADYTESPAMVTDIGMQAAARTFTQTRVLQVYNCPLLHMPTSWFSTAPNSWSSLQELHLVRCHAINLDNFCRAIPMLTNLLLLTLTNMFHEPPKGCSRVGLSAGTGLGVSSALVSNTAGADGAAAGAAPAANQGAANNNAPQQPMGDEDDDDDDDLDDDLGNDDDDMEVEEVVLPAQPGLAAAAGADDEDDEDEDDDDDFPAIIPSNSPVRDADSGNQGHQGCSKEPDGCRPEQQSCSKDLQTEQQSSSKEPQTEQQSCSKEPGDCSSEQQSCSEEPQTGQQGSSKEPDDCSTEQQSCEEPQTKQQSCSKEPDNCSSEQQSCSKEPQTGQQSSSKEPVGCSSEQQSCSKELQTEQGSSSKELQTKQESSKEELQTEQQSSSKESGGCSSEQQSCSEEPQIEQQSSGKEPQTEQQSCSKEPGDCSSEQQSCSEEPQTEQQSSSKEPDGCSTEEMNCSEEAETGQQSCSKETDDCKAEQHSCSEEPQTDKGSCSKELEAEQQTKKQDCSEEHQTELESCIKETDGCSTEQQSCSKELQSEQQSCSEEPETEQLQINKQREPDGCRTEEINCSEEAKTEQQSCSKEPQQDSCSKEPRAEQQSSSKETDGCSAERQSCSKELHTDKQSCSQELQTEQQSCSEELQTEQQSCSEELQTEQQSCSEELQTKKQDCCEELSSSKECDGCSTEQQSSSKQVESETRTTMLQSRQTENSSAEEQGSKHNTVEHSHSAEISGAEQHVNAECSHTEEQDIAKTSVTEVHQDITKTSGSEGKDSSNSRSKKELEDMECDCIEQQGCAETSSTSSDTCSEQLKSTGSDSTNQGERTKMEDGSQNIQEVECRPCQLESASTKDQSSVSKREEEEAGECENSKSPESGRSPSASLSNTDRDTDRGSGRCPLETVEEGGGNFHVQDDTFPGSLYFGESQTIGSGQSSSGTPSQSGRSSLNEGQEPGTMDTDENCDTSGSARGVKRKHDDQEPSTSCQSKIAPPTNSPETVAADTVNKASGTDTTCAKCGICIDTGSSPETEDSKGGREVVPSQHATASAGNEKEHTESQSPSRKGKSLRGKKKGLVKKTRTESDSSQVNQSCQAVSEEIRESTKKNSSETKPSSSSTDSDKAVAENQSKITPKLDQSSSGSSSTGSNQSEPVCDNEEGTSTKAGAESKKTSSSSSKGKVATKDQATSTSDPVVEEDHIQELTIKSATLQCLNLHHVGVTTLLLDDLPKLEVFTASACRVLSDVVINKAPHLRKVSTAQCRKLRHKELVDNVLSQPPCVDRHIVVRPMSSYDDLQLEKQLFSCNKYKYHMCLIRDHSVNPERSLPLRHRLESWVHLASHINQDLIKAPNVKIQESIMYQTGARDRYPWDREIYAIRCLQASGWELTTDISWFRPLQTIRQALAAHPETRGKDSETPRCNSSYINVCLNYMEDDLAEMEELGRPLYPHCALVFVNTCDVNGDPTPDRYL